MNLDSELRIYGYLDPDPPIPGTFKAEVFRAIEQFEQNGRVPDEVVETLAQSVRHLRKNYKPAFN